MDQQRAALYSRYSSEMQSRLSCDDQERECEEIATQLGARVVLVDRDEAVRAGAVAGREGWERLMAGAVRREFDIVVVDEVSRFSRDFFQGIGELTRMRRYGVKLADRKGIRDVETLAGQVQFGLDLAVSQDEVRRLGERSKRGLKGRIQAKRSAGGEPAYGYRRQPLFSETERDLDGQPVRVGVAFAVEEDQAGVVRLIFQRYADGWTKHAIAARLNSDGMRTKRAGRLRVGRRNSGTWCAASIKSILENQIYRGVRLWNQTSRTGRKSDTTGRKRQNRNDPQQVVRVEDFCPAIIENEIWSRAQERLRQDREKYLADNIAGEHRQYLLSGFLRCAACGANFVIGQHRKDGRQYRCSFHARGKAVCANRVTVPQEALEARVRFAIDSLAKDPEQLAKLVATHNARIKAANDAQLSTVRMLTSRRDAVQVEQRRLVDAIKGGSGVPQILLDEIRQGEEELASLGRQVDQAQALVQPLLLPRAPAVTQYLLGRESVFTGEFADDRAVLDGILEAVHVYPEGTLVLRFREGGLFAPVRALEVDLREGPMHGSLEEQRKKHWALSADAMDRVHAGWGGPDGELIIDERPYLTA